MQPNLLIEMMVAIGFATAPEGQSPYGAAIRAIGFATAPLGRSPKEHCLLSDRQSKKVQAYSALRRQNTKKLRRVSCNVVF